MKYKIFSVNLPSLICYFSSAGLILYYLYPTLNFQWGLIDDHELFVYLGLNKKIDFLQIFSLLLQTEVSQESTFTRYRPIYWLFRFFEMYIWGGDPFYWYLFRMAITVLFAVAITSLSLLIAGPILTIFFTLFVFSSNYWLDIVARAGPSETYSLLGISLILIPLCKVIRGNRINIFQSVLISLGVIISAGSKENFAFLICVPLIILIWPKLQKSISIKVVLAISILFVAHIFFTLLGRFKSVTTDIYENSISISYRIELLFNFIQSNAIISLICLLIFALGLIFLWRKRNQEKKLSLDGIFENKVLHFVALELLLIGIYISQFIFYGSIVNQPVRYAFPGILMLQLSVLVAASYLISAACIFGVNNKKIIFIKILLGCIISLWFSPITQLHDNRVRLVQIQRNLINLNQNLLKIRNTLTDNPRISLILVSHSPYDHEPIVAINRILYSEQIKNQIGLIVEGYLPENYHARSLQYRLAKELLDASYIGTKSEGLFANTNAMKPISVLDLNECISVGFSGPPIATCKYGGLLLWPYN